jgi:hypothetical protein
MRYQTENRQETQPAAPSLLTTPSSVVVAPTPAPAPLPSAQSKLDAILQLLDRKDLKGTAMRLPHVSTMRVTTQKRFPSEHPFKIRIGTLPNNGGDVVAFLGPTPKNPEHAPTLLVGTHSYSVPSTKWDKIPFVEPFQQLWNKTTQIRKLTGQAYQDMRRGLLKSLVCWYLLNEAAARDGDFRFPEIVTKNYLVPALEILGRKETMTATPRPGNEALDDDADASAANLGNLERHRIEQGEVEARIKEEAKDDEAESAAHAEKLEEREKTEKRRQQIASIKEELRVLELEEEKESRLAVSPKPATMDVETPSVPTDDASVTDTADTTANKRKRTRIDDRTDERSAASGQLRKRRSPSTTTPSSVSTRKKEPAIDCPGGIRETAPGSGDTGDRNCLTIDDEAGLQSFRRPPPTCTTRMNGQVLKPPATNQQGADTIAKAHTATTSAPGTHSPEGDTPTPATLGAAPWGADGDWQTHFYDHRSHEFGSLIHAFNKPIETSSSTNIIAPPETLPSCTALGNDQCVTALQKTFDDHQKLSTRLEALAREEEEAKVAYEDAVRQREEVEQALMENKTVMGHIAGRLADERGVKMD